MPPVVEASLLRDRIGAALRRSIESGALKAGDRLVEKDLCAKLNVSRASLREAFRDLEAHRIVKLVTPRELIIAPLTREDAANIYRLRGAIELVLVEQFIAYSQPQDIKLLKSALKRLRAARPSEPDSFEAQRDYYLYWSNGARNHVAYDVISNFQLRLSVVRGPNVRDATLYQQSIAEKQALIDSLEKKDAARGQEIVHQYIARAVSVVMGVG